MAPPKAKMEIVTVGGKQVMRMTFSPGWKWSQDIGPAAGSDRCHMHHFGYQLSGVMHIESTDGGEIETAAGEVYDIPPGHDAWVVGGEPVVMIDFAGADGYGK